MKRTGRILSLVMILVIMATAVCFAGTEGGLKLTGTYPEDGYKGAATENMGVKLYFDGQLTEEIKGFKGDEYTTQEKKFQYYELVEVEGQREGIMEGDTTVDYKYRKMKFNLKIDKTIAKININGREIEVNSELGKAEIQRAQIQKAQIKVEYTIKVTNDSQIAGSATIQENIPDTMTMAKADNPDWKIGTTQAMLETQQIQPGQSQEYKVTMQWQNAETTVGTKLNTAEIIKTTNPAGFEETSLEDNKTAAELIIAIGTGETNYILITAGIMLILLGAGVVIYKRRK